MLAICGGLMRTGSLAMFQIMREIVEVRGAGFAPVLEHGNEGEHFDQECCRWACQPEVFVTKLHTYRDSLACENSQCEFGSPRIKVVMTIRDIRDVMVSLIHFKNSTFDSELHARAYTNFSNEYHRWVDHIPAENLLIVKYEDMITDRFTTVLQVARFLDLALNAPEAKAIDRKWDITANVERAKAGHAISSKDFMSPRHIYKGQADVWQEELTEEQIKQVEDDHWDFLVENGYCA